MVNEISKRKWREFLDDLSQRLDGWDTVVEVLSDDIGAQTLISGLPLNGLTLEDKNGIVKIELSVGTDAKSHQSHNIVDPVFVSFEEKGFGRGAMVAIVDRKGAKTLVRFIQPFPLVFERVKTEMVSFG